MELNQGDIVSGRGIQIGIYQGREIINEKEFHKILDLNKNTTFFIPLDNEEMLRKLPTKKTVRQNLKLFDSSDLIDSGEIDGSRYKYFKSKLDEVDFKKSMEVLHDLSSLRSSNEISSSERKLLNDLKEKLLAEMVYILDCEADEISTIVEMKDLSA